MRSDNVEGQNRQVHRGYRQISPGIPTTSVPGMRLRRRRGMFPFGKGAGRSCSVAQSPSPSTFATRHLPLGSLGYRSDSEFVMLLGE